MDAHFGAEVAESVGAADFQGAGAEAGFVAVGGVQHLDGTAAGSGPAGIHPQQHLNPVVGVGAAGAGVDGQDGGAVVVRAREGQLHFGAGQGGGQGIGFGGQFVLHCGVVGVGFGCGDQFQQFGEVGGLRLEAAPEVDGTLDAAQFLHLALGVGGVIPEIGGRRLAVEVGDGLFVAGEVKAAPRRRRGGG